MSLVFDRSDIESTIPDRFDRIAAQFPSHLAIRDQERSWTYNELQRRANQLAHALLERSSVGTGCVAYLVPHSPEMVLCGLGILKAGKTSLCIHPSLPAAAQRDILSDARPDLLVTCRTFEARAREIIEDPCGLFFLEDTEDIAPELQANVSVQIGDAALIFYTSGSTGRPKGVVKSHRAVLHRAWLCSQYDYIRPADRHSLFTYCSFATTESDVYGTLLNGATLCLFDLAMRELDDLAGWIEAEQVTILHPPVMFFRRFLSTLESENLFPSVRLVALAGETVVASDLESWRRHFSISCALRHRFSSTETGNLAVACIEPGALLAPGIVPPVKAVADKFLKVVNESGDEVAPGVEGELIVQSEYLASGYWRRPEETTHAFSIDPRNPKQRTFRTGDLGRLEADGSFKFLGRRDHQVKIRGYRVELKEVESALLMLDSVQEAAVVAYRFNDETRLIAYVVNKQEYLFSAGKLRDELRKKLPEWKVPTRFISLPSMPLTPTGKIDRQSLPPDDFSSGLDSGYVEPRNPIERQLASIWSEVLGIKQVGIQDNFFALGGHSLQAVRLTSRVSEVFGIRLGVRQIFEFPSIAEQALHIEATRLADNNEPSIRLVHRPLEVGKAAPLSHAQQRLWFLEQLEGSFTAYNIPRVWRIRGSLDIESLRKALEAIVLRHEPLRTIFKHDGTMPVQIVQQIGRFDLPVIDFLNIDPQVKKPQLEQSLLSEANRAFDLTCDVMLRAKLFRLEDHEHALILTMHHIASDGWSIDVLSRELSTLYHHFVDTPHSLTDDLSGILAPIPVSYIDYSLWQQENLSGQQIEDLLGYWRNELKGLPALELPTDRPRPSVSKYQGSSIEVKLPENLVAKLESLCSREQVTLQMLLLAAFESLLYRYSHQEDFAVGIPFAGRDDAQLEGLIGFFVSTMVVRADLSGEPTFKELLLRVRSKSLAAYDHQALPLQILLADLQPERHLSRPPLFQVMFQLLNRAETGLSLKGLDVIAQDYQANRVKCDLELRLSPQAGEVSGAFYYSTDLFDTKTIQRMSVHYLRLLESIVANPDEKIGRLEILTDRERSELLFDFNDTTEDYPRGLCVHELFEQQVQRTPDSVAVVFEDQQLTYAELNARANQLARYLRSRGVGIETPVGMCLPRSLDLIVSILGILKAGATYVPLDAEYPTKRLEYMLGISGIEHLVTHRVLLEKLPRSERLDICLDTDAESISMEDASDLGLQIDSNRLAYVIFTSGSTGEPKGVMIEHRSIARLVFQQHYTKFGPDRTFIQLAPVSFDASTFEIWGALLHGSRLVMPAPGLHDSKMIRDLIRRHDITTMWLTSSLFNQIVEDDPRDLRGLDELLIGGESLSHTHVRTAVDLLGEHLTIVNGYGPTESTTFACCFGITDSLPALKSSIPIGRPISNTQAYLLDANEQLVPIGVTGELYIGGDGLARGYLNRPDLTIERFISNPFSQKPDSRLYRSGDLCRWRTDGNLEYLGRIDHQVKLRGFRIELGEIEAVLTNHPAIAQCVVILREDRPGDKRLVAYYTASRESLPSVAQLREHLRASLPEYMIPSALVLLDALPLTTSGKIDRRALPVPDCNDLGQEDCTPPCNGIEKQLVEIWQELLGIKRIGIHDNFFALGGHSLLAVRLFARIEKSFGRKLPLAVLFRQGTIEHLARILAESTRQTDIATVLSLQAAEGGRPLFLMPTMGGGALVSRPLFALLDGCFPIFGLQIALDPQNLDQFRDFRATAASLVTALRQFQAHGPYAIAGFSFGGMMAYEVACQLTELGEKVDLLAIIDTGPSRRGLKLQWNHRLRQAIGIGANIPSWIREESRTFSAKKITIRIGRKLRQFYRQLASQGRTKIQYDDVFDAGRLPLQNREHAQALYEGFRDYIPRPYSGKLTLIRAQTGPLLRGRTPDFGWSRFVSNVDIRPIPGNHETILQPPHVSELARQLLGLMEDLQ